MQKRKQPKNRTITLCASVTFYPTLLEIEKELENLGFRVLLPEGATKMKKDTNFSAEQYKAAYIKDKNHRTKERLINAHFKKIENADAILVVNLEKNGKKGYIGGNVLMEMTLAFYLKKKIFVYNPIEESLPYSDEVMGMQPVFIDQNLVKISF